MTTQITLRQIEGSIGATFPKEITDALNVGPGDRLTVVHTAKGILLTPSDPDFNAGMRAFEAVNAEYENALRDLASK